MYVGFKLSQVLTGNQGGVINNVKAFLNTMYKKLKS